MGKSSSLLFVLELERTVSGPHRSYTAVVSIPGREGTMARSWEAPTGLVDEGALRDLASWVALTVQNAVILDAGAQRQLNL